MRLVKYRGKDDGITNRCWGHHKSMLGASQIDAGVVRDEGEVALSSQVDISTDVLMSQG